MYPFFIQLIITLPLSIFFIYVFGSKLNVGCTNNIAVWIGVGNDHSKQKKHNKSFHSFKY